MSADLKPSDVDLHLVSGYPPFIATFDRVEGEIAAALYTLACRDLSDEWVGLEVLTIFQVLERRIACRTHPKWLENPFYRPDFGDLVRRGFMSFAVDQEASRVYLTPEAPFFIAVARYVAACDATTRFLRECRHEWLDRRRWEDDGGRA